ncbi:hypothetical protein RQY18_07315, partial [Streptococcus pneumoniae]|nr:hypothetical protein [Streptococcus pneumoniae]
DLMGLFFYNKIGSIISIVDLPTTNIIEPEIVFNFQPWLDWYLKETGQRLVGGSGPFAPAAGGHGNADATSGASDSGDAGGHGGDADATAGASY